MTALILLSGSVPLGAGVRWPTGMGFAPAAVPALILLLGPAEGSPRRTARRARRA